MQFQLESKYIPLMSFLDVFSFFGFGTGDVSGPLVVCIRNGNIGGASDPLAACFSVLSGIFLIVFGFSRKSVDFVVASLVLLTASFLLDACGSSLKVQRSFFQT